MKIYNLPNNSFVKVHDIFDPLPSFMHKADCVFTDPPYNQNLCTNFCYKKGAVLSSKNNTQFDAFTNRFFMCVKEINPKFLFIEMGKEYLSWYIEECKKRYKYVTFYNSTYYKKKENKCYVIHATNIFKKRRYKELEDLDEEEIIKWICAHHEYKCIGDLCMGTGLVGKHAYLNGKSFVGTELNKKRLAILIDYIKKQ